MYNRNMSLSKKRVIFYLKRYWWVLLFFSLCGALASGYSIAKGISKNKNEMLSAPYESRVVVALKDNTISTATVIGDCEVILETDGLREYVNAGLEEKGYDMLNSLDSVSLGRVDVSNCFILQVNAGDNEESKFVSRMVIKYLQDKIAEYNQDVNLQLIEGGFQSSDEADGGSVIQLKNILIFIIILLAGIVIVYIMMISDKTIFTMEEVENILSANMSILLNEENEKDILQWLKYESEMNKKICLFYSQETKGVEAVLKNSENKIVQLEKMSARCLEESSSYEKWMVIKANRTNRESLIKIGKLMSLYGTKIECLIFIE